MITSINDIMREKIKNSMNAILLDIELLDEVEKDQILSLMLCDYYKILFIEGINTDNFKLIYGVNKYIEQIKDTYIDDKKLLCTLVKSSVIFNSTSMISKIIIMEQLEAYNQDINLSKICKLHILDKISYSFNYDLEYFKEYYIDYKNKTNNNEDLLVSEFIANKFLQYKDNNYNNYQKFILEFIKVYYKWTIFIKENFDKEFLDKNDLYCLEFINTKSIDDIIKYTEINYEFLTYLIDNYLYYSTSEKNISESIVDEYFYNNVDIEIQKKLKRD